MAELKPTNTSAIADHLCVLVHGLWGHPDHLKYVTTSLRERFPEDKLEILVPKSNAGSFTYDGIELGGERVAHEVEARLDELKTDGHEIKKFSIIGYSLGGLVARYAIGLLYHSGVFDTIQPVNFTTFATPHLGVRTPVKGYHSHLWNVLGARTLSTSGRQLFVIDNFRGTGRPLLAVLADPSNIFIKALAKFEHRSLYANIVNDRTVSYFTAGISQTDPFVDLDSIKINYVSGYSSVILSPDAPVSLADPVPTPAFPERLAATTRQVLHRIPIAAFLTVFIPIGTTLFLFNSAFQTVRSAQRIRLHESGRAGVEPSRYRIPLMLNAARKEVEDLFENVNSAQEHEYLDARSEGIAPSPTQSPSPSQPEQENSHDGHGESTASPQARKPTASASASASAPAPNFPVLALQTDQFRMIEALDNVGFDKFPVYIHNHRHSHAAIIVRMDKASFDEGREVVRHWLDNFAL